MFILPLQFSSRVFQKHPSSLPIQQFPIRAHVSICPWDNYITYMIQNPTRIRNKKTRKTQESKELRENKWKRVFTVSVEPWPCSVLSEPGTANCSVR